MFFQNAAVSILSVFSHFCGTFVMLCFVALHAPLAANAQPGKASPAAASERELLKSTMQTYIRLARENNLAIDDQVYKDCSLVDGDLSSDSAACGPCTERIIEIGPIDIVPSGPLPGLTPHISPGIPFTIENFLECPFGRVIYHPAITVTVEITCPGCGTIRIEKRRVQFRGGQDGEIVLMCPGEKIRDRDPEDLEGSPKRSFSPPISDVPYPRGPYQGIPTEPGSFNCGTSLLCYLANLLGREEAERFMREAQEALRKAKGKCHHFAWEVVEDPWANCPVVVANF